MPIPIEELPPEVQRLVLLPAELSSFISQSNGRLDALEQRTAELERRLADVAYLKGLAMVVLTLYNMERSTEMVQAAAQSLHEAMKVS